MIDWVKGRSDYTSVSHLAAMEEYGKLQYQSALDSIEQWVNNHKEGLIHYKDILKKISEIKTK